ncbi:MAG TPA: hypothetical protein DGG95_01980 [Cytophagales bacterium]|jgi:hypothetical protein|nr:hypothetical protein [Cytophagales bacterium]
MRNKERIQKRDEALFVRYLNLYDIKRKRHDDVINQLADEFFIDPETVNKIIRKTSKGGK